MDAAADATGQLDILDAEDILESDEISALEAAAEGIVCFEVDQAPTPEPSGFEIGDVGAFDEVEVEGEIEAPPPSLSTLFGIKPKAAPIKAAVVPAAPVTSPLPLESAEAVVVPAPVAAAASASEREAAPVSKSEPIADRTLELKRSDFAIAVATAKIEAEERAAHDNAEDAPGHTQVLVRAAMPAAIRTIQGGMQAPTRRPSSIAPVALDIAAAPRATAPSVPAFPPPARMPSYASVTPKRGLSGVAIGVIAFSALALVGLVGIGGYAASRALTEKSDPVAAANAPESSGLPSSAVVAPAAASAPEAPNASPSTIGTGFAIDVSALPTAPVPGAAPRIATGRTTAPSAPAGAPLAAAGPVAPAPVSKSSGGALPPPGGGKTASAPLAAPGAPLPPPPAAAPAPAAPAVVATTGTVRVDPNLRAVVVDGSFRRANDGVVVVACGAHRLQVGMKSEQPVNVPCGGSVAL